MGTANSSTISFASSGFTANWHRIGGTEQTLPKVKDSHLLTEEKETYIPGDLYEPGEFDGEFEYVPGTIPPLGQVEQITITYPVPPGMSNGGTVSGTGFAISRSSPTLENNTLMMGNVTICWDGKSGPTYTAAS